MLRKIKKSDCSNFQDYCSRFGKNLFIDSSLKSLEKEFNKLLKNNYCFIDEENDKINGLLFVQKVNTDYYIKTIYKNPKILDRLFQVLFWEFKKDIIIKLNNYKVVHVLKKNFFRLINKTDTEYTYFRKYYQKVKKDG